MKPRAFAFLALILALSLFASAAQLSGPKLAGKASVRLDMGWTFDFGSSRPADFDFTAFGFPTTATQSANYEGQGTSISRGTDSRGNPIVMFKLNPQSNVETVRLTAQVSTDYSNWDSISGDISPYLKLGGLADSNADLSAKADQLTSGASGGMEKLAILTEFVHNLVRYDGAGYGNTQMSATWTLANKIGTCDEYSHLLISLLRDENIPAKFVAGFVCSSNCNNSESWGPHAWVEAAIDGKWVPSDPTFNEAGLLDATHIKFAQGVDQTEIKEHLGTSDGAYDIRKVNITRTFAITVDFWSAPTDYLSVALEATNDTHGPASIASVNLSVVNLLDRPALAALTLNMPQGMVLAEGEAAVLYLPPQSTGKKEWHVVFPKDLEKGFVYNYTVFADGVGLRAEQYMIASATGQTSSQSAVEIYNVNTSMENNILTVWVSVKNNGNQDVPLIIAELDSPQINDSKQFPVLAQDSAQTSFTVPLSPDVSQFFGTIHVQTPTQDINQPIRVTLVTSGAPATPAVPMQAYPPMTYLVAGAIVMIIIMALAVLIKKAGNQGA